MIRDPFQRQKGTGTKPCLTIVTIATAALAAVFFVSGLGKPANDPGNSLTLIKMMATCSRQYWWDSMPDGAVAG